MISIREASLSPAFALDLPVQRQEDQERLDELYARGLFTELAEFMDPASTDEFPVPMRIPRPAPKIGMLYWPAFGATRFAHATFLIDAYTLGLLRTQLGTGNRVKVGYRDSDNDPNGLEIPRDWTMYLVSARPLCQTGDQPDPFPAPPPSTDDAYILTLVDARFYWQYSAGTGYGGTPATWNQLISSCLTKLGATYTIDLVPPALLQPTAKWKGDRVTGIPTSILLESAVSTIGMRVAVGSNGAVEVQAPGNTYFTRLRDFDSDNALNFIAGGFVADEEPLRAVPANVLTILFDPLSVSCSNVGSQTTTLNSLALTQYSGVSGVSGRYVVLWADAPKTITAAQANLLSSTLATYWYYWQVVPLEATYAGFPQTPISAFAGHWELFHDGHLGFTRVTRPPVNHSELFGKSVSCGSVSLPPPPPATPSDCGIFQGFEDDDCFTLSVVSTSGKCSCIPLSQNLLMVWNSGMSGWLSQTDFYTCHAHGKALLQNTDPCCSPKLTLKGVGTASADVVLGPQGCGTDSGGHPYVDFVGAGSVLCSSSSPPPTPPPPPPPPPPGPCCESTITNGLAGDLYIPNGPHAGHWPFTWTVDSSTSGSGTQGAVNSGAPNFFFYVFCHSPAQPNFLGQFSTNSGSMTFPPSSVACGPPSVITFPGFYFGSSSDVTVTS